MEDPPQAFAEYIEDIKESLTDAQYKQGMDLCQALFKQEKPEEQLYRMTYLSPHVFSDTHDCDDEDCVHSRSLNISFVKKVMLIKMKPERAAEILEENCFTGDDIEDYIETSVLANHQEFDMDLPDFEWDTFPVLKLELV